MAGTPHHTGPAAATPQSTGSLVLHPRATPTPATAPAAAPAAAPTPATATYIDAHRSYNHVIGSAAAAAAPVPSAGAPTARRMRAPPSAPYVDAHRSTALPPPPDVRAPRQGPQLVSQSEAAQPTLPRAAGNVRYAWQTPRNPILDGECAAQPAPAVERRYANQTTSTDADSLMLMRSSQQQAAVSTAAEPARPSGAAADKNRYFDADFKPSRRMYADKYQPSPAKQRDTFRRGTNPVTSVHHMTPRKSNILSFDEQPAAAAAAATTAVPEGGPDRPGTSGGVRSFACHNRRSQQEWDLPKRTPLTPHPERNSLLALSEEHAAGRRVVRPPKPASDINNVLGYRYSGGLAGEWTSELRQRDDDKREYDRTIREQIHVEQRRIAEDIARAAAQ